MSKNFTNIGCKFTAKKGLFFLAKLGTFAFVAIFGTFFLAFLEQEVLQEGSGGY